VQHFTKSIVLLYEGHRNSSQAKYTTMKLQNLVTRWVLASAATMGLVIALAAWTDHPQQHKNLNTHLRDTTPDKRLRDLDRELQKLEEARTHLEKMKDKDWEKIQRDVEESIRKIDVEKIQHQAAAAMQRLDLEKTQQQIEESLSRIDFDKIQQQIDESMAKVDKVDQQEIREQLQKAKVQVKEAMENQSWKEDLAKAQKINQEAMQQQMVEVQKQMQKLKKDMQLEKFNFSKEMEKAKLEVEKAKEELKGYQEMIYSMEKDGLLDTKENYTIEYKNGNLFINDKKQPADITNRYKQYFKKDKIAIKKEDGEMHIQHNSDKHLD
jgi:chromosome segregation ATPase